MFSRILFWGIIGSIFVASLFYLIFSESYQKSIRAKTYYTFGDYKEAYKLAKEAFLLDKYNKMAFTVMSQSGINMGFIDFIELARGYQDEIKQIIEDGVVEIVKIKIKIICEVVIGSFKEVKSKTIMTDKTILKEANELNEWFERVYLEAFAK